MVPYYMSYLIKKCSVAVWIDNYNWIYNFGTLPVLNIEQQTMLRLD